MHMYAYTYIHIYVFTCYLFNVGWVVESFLCNQRQGYFLADESEVEVSISAFDNVEYEF